MGLFQLYALGCMVIEEGHTLKGPITLDTGDNGLLLQGLRLQTIRKLLQMDPQEMNKTITLANILILASRTRTLECFPVLEFICVTRLYMHIQERVL
jgi:hypothetical protein